LEGDGRPTGTRPEVAAQLMREYAPASSAYSPELNPKENI
jgi:hypothetical protein